MKGNGTLTRIVAGVVVAIIMLIIGLSLNGVQTNAKDISALKADNESVEKRLDRIETKIDKLLMRR